jgi:hypothetical protein
LSIDFKIENFNKFFQIPADFVCISEYNIVKSSGTTGIAGMKLTYIYDPPIDLTSYLGIYIKMTNDNGKQTYFEVILTDENNNKGYLMYYLGTYNSAFGYNLTFGGELIYNFANFNCNIDAIKSISFELTPPLVSNDYYYKFANIICNDCYFWNAYSIPNYNTIHKTFDNNIYTYLTTVNTSLSNYTNTLIYDYDNNFKVATIKLIWMDYEPINYTIEITNARNTTFTIQNVTRVVDQNFIYTEYQLNKKFRKYNITRIKITIFPDNRNINYKLCEYKTMI